MVVLIWICRGCGMGITDRNITTVNDEGEVVGCTECTDLPPLDVITVSLDEEYDMSYPVPADKIEEIVGARRHATEHVARAKSDEAWVYILHSAECLETYGGDLTECPFSVALDDGIEIHHWVEDTAVAIEIGSDGRLVPKNGGAHLELIGSAE